MISLKLFCAFVFTLFARAFSHGIMCTPRQRGAYHSIRCGSNLPNPKDPVIDDCPHCLSGGTVSTVSKHLPKSGWSLYDPLKDPSTTTRAGLCGDPFGDNEHMIGGRCMPYKRTPIVAHWKTGSLVDFQVEIDTNHNGYFEFFLCNLDACRSKDISGKCMQNGHCYRLKRAPHPDCQNPSKKTHFECGPIDEVYPGRWYVPCRKTEHVGIHIVGGSSGTMRYILPKGVNCNHCVLQWYWATANSCAPRGFLEYFKTHNNPFGTVCESDGGGRGAHRPGMAACSGPLLPEEFWSCADVKISSKGAQTRPAKNFKDGRIPVAKQTKKPKKPTPQSAAAKGKLPQNGRCLKKNEACNGKMACCRGHVCAYSLQGRSVCIPWRDLSKEALGGNKSMCIKGIKACNRKKSCCYEHVCAYTRKEGFVCKIWHTLWEEAFP